MALFNRKRHRNGEKMEAFQALINSKPVTLTPLKDKAGLGVLIYRDKSAVGPHGQWFKAAWGDGAGHLRDAQVIGMWSEAAPQKTQFSNGRREKTCFCAFMLKPEGGAYELRLESNKDEQTVGFKNKDGDNLYQTDKGYIFGTVEQFLESQDEHDKNRDAYEKSVKARDPDQFRTDFMAQNQDILKTIAASLQAKGGKGAPA
jgi:hypothetical protein